jgi:hypothetical protein
MHGVRCGIILTVLALVATSIPSAHAQLTDDQLVEKMRETDRPARVDYGYGPGVSRSEGKARIEAQKAASQAKQKTTTQGAQ